MVEQWNTDPGPTKVDEEDHLVKLLATLLNGPNGALRDDLISHVNQLINDRRGQSETLIP